MGVRCFLIEPVGKEQRYLRRYNGELKCSGPMGYHDYMVPLDVVPAHLGERGCWELELENAQPEPPHTVPPWPGSCLCGYLFQDTDHWQLFDSSIYKRVDSGEEFTLRDAPVGAIWRAYWMEDVPGWCGSDGKAYVCRLPGNHDWQIDGTATNCPWQDGSHPTHRCWIRHGDAPNFTVDKNGDTCAAGGGSISVPGWHGFLRNGELVNA